MYMRCLRHVARKSAFEYFSPYSARFYSTTKTSAPLRILFCGADEFSIASLRALHKEHKRDPQLIESIDVLCRPGKLTGRGLKTLREAPIKAAAIKLGLTVYERDTFTGWDLPQAKEGPINLLIAVSFGLFVPPRILNSVEYGGLNVHPSMLPHLRGPAPLQHTILEGRSTTGITLQTLDPKAFDHGTILAQTPRPGFEIPEPLTCTHEDLQEFMTPKAADMLVQGIRDRVFVPPLEDVGWSKSTHLVHATKITPEHREVDWAQCSGVKFSRCHRAMGRLWNTIYVDATTKKRVVYEEWDLVPIPPALKKYIDSRGVDDRGLEDGVHSFLYDRPGGFKPQMYVVDNDAIVTAGVNEHDGMCVRLKFVTVEGDKKRAAARAMSEFRDRDVWEEEKDRLKTMAQTRARAKEGKRENTAMRKMAIQKKKESKMGKLEKGGGEDVGDAVAPETVSKPVVKKKFVNMKFIESSIVRKLYIDKK